MPDALSFLLGAWHIERRIDDHALAVSGSFAGEARWVPAADPAAAELVYDERGELRFNGHRGPASRRLIYRGRPDGTADVLFADGRYFYHLDARTGSWQARHDCGRDVYELSARLLRPGELEAGEFDAGEFEAAEFEAAEFEERWRVRGPGKDYEIMTTLVRDGEDAC